MRYVKQVLDFYIGSSIHVALSVYALVRMTGFLFGISEIQACAYFAFFGTISAYNFVKYDALVRTQKKRVSSSLKAIALLSLVSFLGAVFYFLQLAQITKIIAVVFLILTLLYTLPFFPNAKNARNWAGVKIYIVAVCWVGVTLFLPIINAGLSFSTEVFIVGVQRFILIFVLILIFEIIDLKEDDPHLQTVPQQIGVSRTKKLGLFLMLFFIGLEFLFVHFNPTVFVLKTGIAVTVMLFLLLANEQRSKYYSAFWVESIPIVWMILLLSLG
ncbi:MULTISPECIES: UbiA prenyltransferase family protein [Flavobacterium]|uniref:Prenyltransferase n=1 Tax=Flavobacterium sedimenticola TaxID=3043286 RepID=A0ABT6XSE8_9FLAO|nr:hypothetical protein [Flavobacterium sedimenticola]MDI9258029.1 hypothetical protein [Flavobacterium sedimenticola]